MNKSARFGMGEQALAGRFVPSTRNNGVLARPGATYFNLSAKLIIPVWAREYWSSGQ